MSDFFVSWHMIVREDDENLKKVLDSIQGLYDELIIGVDSRPESDNVFDLVQLYANVIAFRQEWPGRFDRARQEVLNKVSLQATYIGCCDSDEVLATPSPLEIRQWLQETQPKAVNVGIKYLYDVGPNFKGATYLRTKIWKAEYPRHWVGWIHEYPTVNDEFHLPTAARHIIFEHLKVDHKAYRSELIIEAMLSDIKRGLVRWYPYLAQEYRALGQHERAIDCCLLYFKTKDIKDKHVSVALEELLYNLNVITPNKWQAFLSKMTNLENLNYNVLQTNAIICEYVALAYYYLDNRELGKHWHRKALSLFGNTKEYPFITRKNKYFC